MKLFRTPDVRTWYGTTKALDLPVLGHEPTTMRDVLDNVAGHAAPIIDDPGSGCEATEADLAVTLAVLAEPTTTGGRPVTPEEVEAMVRVIGLGAEYMLINNYADDPYFPDDQLAAQVIAGDDINGGEGYVRIMLGQAMPT